MHNYYAAPARTHVWTQGQKQSILHFPLKSKFCCFTFRAGGFSPIIAKYLTYNKSPPNFVLTLCSLVEAMDGNIKQHPHLPINHKDVVFRREIFFIPIWIEIWVFLKVKEYEKLFIIPLTYFPEICWIKTSRLWPFVSPFTEIWGVV